MKFGPKCKFTLMLLLMQAAYSIRYLSSYSKIPYSSCWQDATNIILHFYRVDRFPSEMKWHFIDWTVNLSNK